MRGTWQTEGGGPDGSVIALVLLLVLFCAGSGGAAAAAGAVTRLLMWLLIVAAAVVVLGAAGLIWWLRGRAAREARAAAIYAARFQSVRAAAKPQVTAPKPAAVEYHVHHHYPAGSDEPARRAIPGRLLP